MRITNKSRHTWSRALRVAAVLAMVLLAARAEPQAERRMELDPSRGSLWIQGDSTLHVFSSTASGLQGWLQLRDPQTGPVITALECTVPAGELRSGDAKLDRNMRRHLGAETFPLISFKVAEALPLSTSGGELQLRGPMAINGVEREELVNAKVSVSQEEARFSGTQVLRMSDYGIKPPVMMLGALKTKNEIQVHFDVFFHTLEPPVQLNSTRKEPSP